jgi:hypothetical protein
MRQLKEGAIELTNINAYAARNKKIRLCTGRIIH